MAASRLLSIVLQTRCAQTRETMLVDRTLPRQKLVDGQRISLACLLNAEKTTANGGDNFGLATDHPSLCVPRGKIGDRER